jgi:iron complex transport system permease protein
VSESGRRRVTFAVLAALLPLTLMLAVAVGSVRLPLLPLLGSLGLPVGARLTPPADTILWSVRLPRVLLAAVVGGGLAVVGAALQSVFRNPMADAGLLGVGPGAAFGAVLAVRSGVSETFLGLPASAFAGAMTASLAVSAIAAAGTSLLLVATEEFRVKAVLFWLAGGLEGRGWAHLRLAAAAIAAGGALLLALARPLDVLALGEEEAASLGLRVHLTRVAILGVASLIAGAATAASGSVPFVGLIAPHALRPAVGPLARHLLPAAFLAGAALVVVADLGARTLSDRLDLPLGSLTAFIGAPYFLFALRAQEERS